MLVLEVFVPLTQTFAIENAIGLDGAQTKPSSALPPNELNQFGRVIPAIE